MDDYCRLKTNQPHIYDYVDAVKIRSDVRDRTYGNVNLQDYPVCDNNQEQDPAYATAITHIN